jgi:hypothetical protein
LAAVTSIWAVFVLLFTEPAYDAQSK